MLTNKRCPYCASLMTYYDREMSRMYCHKCTRFFDLPGATSPVAYTKTEVKESEDMRDKLDGAKIKELIDDGKSIVEVIAATGYNKGSVCTFLRREGIKPKVDGRSLRYKNKANEPTKQLSPAKIKEVKVHAKALGIKHSGGDPDTAGIISQIDVKIAEHLKQIEKLSKAKQILAA